MGKTIPGGLYYVNGQAVNGNGDVIPDAPPMGPDTVPAPVVGSVTAPVAPAVDIDALVAAKVAEQVAAKLDEAVAAKLAELTAPDAPKADTKAEKK